jgi:hypothetical protein
VAVRRSRLTAPVLAALLLAGCSGPVVTGSGAGGSRSGGGSSSPTGVPSSPSPSAGSTGDPSGSTGGVIARTPVSSAIGDPVTADLCAAIGVEALRGVGTGLTPSIDDRQYPPGCSMTLSAGTESQFGISVYGDDSRPRNSTGRTSRTESGQTVYVFPFDPATGQCERQIDAAGVLLTVDAYRRSSAKTDKTTYCAGSDAMTARLAAVVTGTNVPRLALARPSLTELDACKVTRAANVTSLSAFAGGVIREQGFGASCEVRPSDLFLFFNLVVSKEPRPAGATEVTVDGHQLYSTGTGSTYCSSVSTQGATAGGGYEQLVVTATATDAKKAPADLCDQTGRATAKYLTAAGRR